MHSFSKKSTNLCLHPSIPVVAFRSNPCPSQLSERAGVDKHQDLRWRKLHRLWILQGPPQDQALQARSGPAWRSLCEARQVCTLCLGDQSIVCKSFMVCTYILHYKSHIIYGHILTRIANFVYGCFSERMRV